MFRNTIEEETFSVRPRRWKHWLSRFGCDAAKIESARQPALQWALERGSRSGRVALHFARDWAGRH